MHTPYRIPQWLDSFIFDSLEARINYDHCKVMNNLENSHLDNLNYLGTYFPRTYTEIKTVMKKLSRETDYFDHQDIRFKRGFRILSVGCGTGGDVVSMIDSISEITGCQIFSVTLIDGNIDALEICQEIISMQGSVKGLRIQTEIINETIEEPSDFEKITEMIYFQKFDFIVTSKFINELIDKLDNVYSNFAASFSAILDIKGLIIITDTTDKRINRGAEVWIPKIMNSDLNSNIGVNADIGTIMPPPCTAQAAMNNATPVSRMNIAAREMIPELHFAF